MKAKIDLRVEILEGDDMGYVLEEQNRIVDLEKSNWSGLIEPYKVVVEFVTPNILREAHNRRSELDTDPDYTSKEYDHDDQ